HDRNHAVAVLTNVAVGLDACLDHTFDFIRSFLDLPRTCYQAANRITEPVVRSRKNDESQLLTEKIDRWRAQRGYSQSLRHGAKPGVDRARGKKLDLLIRVETEVLQYQPRHCLESTAISVDANRFTL